jgi:hypothetical protein
MCEKIEERKQLLIKHYNNWSLAIQHQFKHVLKNGTVSVETFRRILDAIPKLAPFSTVSLKIYTDIIIKDIKDIETDLNEKVNELNNFITYTSAYEETNLIYYIVPRRAFCEHWFKYYYNITPPGPF